MDLATTFAVAVAICFAPLAAQAETTPAAVTAPVQPDGGKHWEACKADIAKLCGSVDRSVKGAMRTCLDGHAAELSDGCKTSRVEHAAKEKDKAGEAKAAPK
jgi:hypothetical protein